MHKCFFCVLKSENKHQNRKGCSRFELWFIKSLRKGVERYKSIDTSFWIKSMNEEEEFRLHRICSEMEPSMKDIHEILNRHGSLDIMLLKKRVGITQSEYLVANLFANVEKLGEIV